MFTVVSKRSGCFSISHFKKSSGLKLKNSPAYFEDYSIESGRDENIMKENQENRGDRLTLFLNRHLCNVYSMEAGIIMLQSLGNKPQP